MAPRPQQVPAVVGGLNEEVTRRFADSSTQTTTFSKSISVQVASRGVDMATQTDFQVPCQRECCATKDEPMIENVEDTVSQIDGCQDAEKTYMVIPVIPAPPTDPSMELVKPPTPELTSNTEDAPAVPPPPPPPVAAPMPPPLPAGMSTPGGNLEKSVIASGSLQASPPPPPPMMKPTSSDEQQNNQKITLPKTSIKMKTLHWHKAPKQKIGKQCEWWSPVGQFALKVDVAEMEDLFGQKPAAKKSSVGTEGEKGKQPKSVTVLDKQRSFLVNIFLRQFKGNTDMVLDGLRNGVGLPVDILKSLIKLMPEKKEIASIRAQASCNNLGDAETFFLHLSDIADYELRVQAMLYREEFHERFCDVSSHVEGLLDICEFLINDCSLKQFLLLILQLGNQLNNGTHAGSAAAFKLSTLPMLADLKANKPKVTFLHYIVKVACGHNANLEFRTRLADLQKMSKTPIAAVEEEVKSLAEGINELNKKIKNSRVSAKFGDFYQIAKERVDDLVKKTKTMKQMQSQVAVHFCEEPASFQLNQCYQLFADFFLQINTVLKDNEEMKKLEEKSTKLRNQKRSSNKRVSGKWDEPVDKMDQAIILTIEGDY